MKLRRRKYETPKLKLLEPPLYGGKTELRVAYINYILAVEARKLSETLS